MLEEQRRRAAMAQNSAKAQARPREARPATAKRMEIRRPNAPNANEERIVWLLIVLVGILIIASLSFTVSYLKKDHGGPDIPADVTSEQTDKTPQQTGDTTTGNGDSSTKAPETTEKPKEPEIPVPTFKADLSAYEQYMNPTGDARDAYLLLVNPDNSLAASDVPKDLVEVKSTRKDGRATQKLREYAAKALEALMLEADACGMVRTNTPSGYPLSVMSAYRTYEYQGQLFNGYVNNEMAKRGITRAQAEAIVVTYSCRPGTSEHQTGLCVDMHTLSAANEAFKNQEEAKWLADNCHKFGFILRFPEDKTEITKITYEPWHFRYVGRYHATRMKDLGMCLEEYVEYLAKN